MRGDGRRVKKTGSTKVVGAPAPLALLLAVTGVLVTTAGPRASGASGGESPGAQAGTVEAPADSLDANSTSLPFVLTPGESLQWGRSHDGGGRAAPAGIAVDDFGRVYVSDAAQHRLVRFDAAGQVIGQSGSLGSGEGRMRRPGSVATLGTLSVAVLDRENRRILSYDLFGRLLGVLIDFDAGALTRILGRIEPVVMASDRGGAVYVADAERDRVLVFDFAGRYLRTIGGVGAEPGSFRGLRGLGSGARGTLVTAERDVPRVQRLDSSGAVEAWWTIPVRPGREAIAVAVGDSGRIAIADEAAGTLWIFDGWGHPLAVARGLGAPRAVGFAPNGSLWVAEAAHAAVRRWRIQPAGERASDRRE